MLALIPKDGYTYDLAGGIQCTSASCPHKHEYCSTSVERGSYASKELWPHVCARSHSCVNDTNWGGTSYLATIAATPSYAAETAATANTQEDDTISQEWPHDITPSRVYHVNCTYYKTDKKVGNTTYKAGTLVIEPKEGDTDGTFDQTYPKDSPWRWFEREKSAKIKRIIFKARTTADGKTIYPKMYIPSGFTPQSMFAKMPHLEIVDMSELRWEIIPHWNGNPLSASDMFESPNIHTIIFNNTLTFENERLTSLSMLFQNATSLRKIISDSDLSKYKQAGKDIYDSLDEDKTSSTSGLSCISLKYINDLSLFFSGCKSLTNITFPDSFDTSKVKNFGGMFRGYFPSRHSLDEFIEEDGELTSSSGSYNLTALDLSNLDTSSATSMNQMFCGQEGLEELTLTGKFTMKNLGSMSGMFAGTHALKKLTVNNKTRFSNLSGLCDPADKKFEQYIRPYFKKDDTHKYTGKWVVQDVKNPTDADRLSADDFHNTTKKFLKLKEKYGENPFTLIWEEGERETPKPSPSPSPAPSPSVGGGGIGLGGLSTARTALMRLYNPWTGEHLFTTHKCEVTKLTRIGWRNEGKIGYVATSGTTPVFRLFNAYSGDHHYTTDKNEVEACVRDGWKDEGIVFYSEGSVGMTSMYNPYEKHFYHHYTSDECEIACMIEEGWKREAVKWYCIGLDE